MEVEVKLRIPDSLAHQHLSDLLAARHLRTHHQENIFFDGSRGDLSSRFAVLRLRFYDGDSRCVASLKARAQLSGGVSRVEEDEEDVDPSSARACIAEPWRLPALPSDVAGGGGPSRILKRVVDEFGAGAEGLEFLCLGGFRNVRGVFGWDEGLTLELDETHYDFGTSYELECETTDPDRAKELLEGFLKQNEIPYSYSTASKFAVFRAGKLIS